MNLMDMKKSSIDILLEWVEKVGILTVFLFAQAFFYIEAAL